MHTWTATSPKPQPRGHPKTALMLYSRYAGAHTQSTNSDYIRTTTSSTSKEESGHPKLNFTFVSGRGGAAAGIRTRVFSLRLGNFEAWEAPVIDQVILTAQL